MSYTLSAFMRRLAALGFVALVLATPSIPALAQAQADPAVINRLNRIEADLNTLQRSVYRGAPPPVGGGTLNPEIAGGAAFNTLDMRLGETEDRMRQMTGAQEESDFRLRQLENQIKQLAQDIEFRFTELEKKLNAQAASSQATSSQAPQQAPASSANPPTTAQTAPTTQTAPQPAPGPTNLGQLRVDRDGNATAGTASGPTPVPGANQASPATQAATGQAATGQAATGPAATGPAATGPAAPQAGSASATQTASATAGRAVARTPREQYDASMAFMRRGEYVRASEGFETFLTTWPQDGLAGNAHYWLGESHYVRKDYERAAKAFLEGYQKHPKNNKAPDSLVKLGMSLGHLSQQREACAVYKQFEREFPNPGQSLRQLVTSEKARINCR